MTEIERYEFDLGGDLVIPQILSADETAQLVQAVEVLRAHAQEHLNEKPPVQKLRGDNYVEK